MPDALNRLDQTRQFLALSIEAERRIAGRKLWTYYPEDGPFRRELYVPHMEFFLAGTRFRERCMIAANRVGKTEGVGGYELALHLTGLYPDWWPGRRFNKPIKAWAAGKTGQTVRDILQEKLLGPPNAWGTGLIPADAFDPKTDVKRKAGGVPDAVESVRVKNKFGGYSRLGFKSFDQGRQSFEGVEQDVIWLDEECPDSIYGECVIRTMTTEGLVLLTFTPLLGLSEVVMRFMPEGIMPQDSGEDTGRYVVNATWDDAPHLSEEAKAEMLSSAPPHLRDARSMGKPHMGAGAVYPVDEEKYVVEPFQIPEYWPRAYALDVGWNKTAALWGAWNRDEDVCYLYSEHYVSQEPPPIHAAAIKGRGEWIPGVIDPASRGRSQSDGEALLDEYEELGLDLTPANNAVEAGIYEVWTGLTSGKLKVFNTLFNLQAEMRLYRRDEKGKIVKERDHLLDCLRYLLLSGKDNAISEYMARMTEEARYEDHDAGVKITNPIGGYF